jgi:large subunit ribosomal protein L15
MQLHELRQPKGATKRKTRVGRGIGSGKGKTCGRGTKGQKSRTNIHPAFEGGQTPIHRRLPIKKGFRNPNAVVYAVVNLEDLQEFFKSGEVVDIDKLREKGLIQKNLDGVKVLGYGELNKKLKVRVDKFSAKAKAAIEEAGGEATVVDPSEKPKKSSKKKKQAEEEASSK